MRIWHKNLIPVLPRQQLLGQWRECCLIAKKDCKPNHVLVNAVTMYPKDHFYTYCKMIKQEMLRRGYKVSYAAEAMIFHELWDYIPNKLLFIGWHNDRYLQQCLANLQEKADCGAIPPDEWKKIAEKYPEWK